MATFDDRGLVIDKMSTIVSNLQQSARTKFQDLLDVGETLSVDESSLIGRLIAIISEPLTLQEEALQQVYAAKDIDQATGLALDSLVELSGLFRQGITPATAYLILYGDIGVTVGVGSFVTSQITGDRFATDNGITFTNTDINGVEVDFNDIGVAATRTLTYLINGNNNTNTPITVLTTTTDTKKNITDKFIQVINSQTTTLEASATNDDKLTVRIKNRNNIGTISTSANSPIVRSYKPVGSTCVTITAISQAVDSLNIIQSPTLGWRGVSNPFNTTASKDVESDSDLRIRYKITKGFDSFGSYASMYAALYNILGVNYVNIQENIFDNPSQTGRTAHGVSIVVLGGEDNVIAQTISNNLPLGCATDGEIQVIAKDINGVDHIVNFSRPDLVPIEISLSLLTYPDYPTNGGDLIRQAIIDYFNTLAVGDDIIYSRLYSPINTVSGFGVNDLLIGRKGATLVRGNITLLFNELPTISYEDISI